MTTETYKALPGVDWVNGRRVPDSREVELTAAEARFDLDHGRIEPKADDAEATDPVADLVDAGAAPIAADAETPLV